jgi:hypothetical protein
VAVVHDPRPTIERLFDLLGRHRGGALKTALEDDLVPHIQEVMLGAGTMDQGLDLAAAGGGAAGACMC